MANAVRPVTHQETTAGVVAGSRRLMGRHNVPVTAKWYNQHLGEIVPPDSPRGEDEFDFPSLWWVRD